LTAVMSVQALWLIRSQRLNALSGIIAAPLGVPFKRSTYYDAHIPS